MGACDAGGEPHLNPAGGGSASSDPLPCQVPSAPRGVPGGSLSALLRSGALGVPGGPSEGLAVTPLGHRFGEQLGQDAAPPRGPAGTPNQG